MCILCFQILYVDGSEFKTDPISVLNTIQKFLGLDNVINYQNILKWVLYDLNVKYRSHNPAAAF